ncbi:MAG: endolytic transglycosylase MltG [Yoonia sp.]|nr:endolytic transglycosylase MltG [Yoonia sp.]
MWRHIASNALTFFVVALFLVAGVISYGATQYSQPGPLAQAICLQVDRGSTMRRVSQNLLDEGAIQSASVMRIGADYSEKTSQLKAGNFLVPEAASMEEIVDIVTRGGQNTCGTEVVYRVGVTRTQIQVRELDPATNRFVEVAAFNPAEDAAPEVYEAVKEAVDTRYRVAMAEGVTSWQVLNALRGLDLLEADVDAVPAEGSLAPDSYDFQPGTPVSSIIDRMTAEQERIIADAWAARADDLPLSSPQEALVLASIVEKETGLAAERRQVASVFVNRLNLGMKLQTDPSVIYGITKGEGILGRGLRRSELRADTPWNTYVIPALPPTPIANPGRAAIEAVLDPDRSEYIFFVADGTGGHAFAVTLAEHNRNVQAWRAIEAERANNDDG